MFDYFDLWTVVQCLGILSWMFVKIYDSLEKFLRNYHTVYLEQKRTANTFESCWQLLLTILQSTSTTSVISKCSTFSLFLSLFYCWYFQVISLLQVLKVQDYNIRNFKCNSIFNFIYIYLYKWFISIFTMLF